MHEQQISQFFANLVVIIVVAKLFAEIAQHFNQPAILGELMGGVLLGLGWFPHFEPNDRLLLMLADLGVILLLFETGLESDPEQLLKVGLSSFLVACAGMMAPFALGYGLMTLSGAGRIESVLVGAALTATSIGITARVLADLGKLSTLEAHIILGAAVIDDILGVIILSVVEKMAGAGTASWGSAIRTAFLAFAFLTVALAVGPRLSKSLVGLASRLKSRGVLFVTAFAFTLGLSLVAHMMGTALIVGAFTAGLLLAQTERKAHIRQSLEPVADLFVPIFFVMVGANVNLRNYNPLLPGNWRVIGLAVSLIIVAVIGKAVSGWVVRKPGINHWGIGMGMVPRGEVGLIFAQFGLAAQVIDRSLYSALIAMVAGTTFFAPILLKKTFGKSKSIY